MLKLGKNVEIHLETSEPPYRVFGTFIEEDDREVTVRGTIGDDIHKRIVVPRTRIIKIVFLD